MHQENDNIITLVLVTTIMIQLLSIGVILLLFSYRNKQLQHQKKISEIQLENDKLILSSQIEIQEETIQNIAREIHDNIGLSLTLAKLDINTIDLRHVIESKKKIENASELIGKALTDLRHLSHSLNSEVVKNNGLLKAIKNELSRIQKSGLLNIKLETKGQVVYIDANRELLIFRMLQECLNNIIKHSQAKKALVKITYLDDSLEIGIEDNGIGIKNFNTKSKKGSGLLTMEARVKMLGGRIEIKSNNNGTKIKLIIPF